jgi:lipoprotein-releasing system permease protein
MTKRSREVRLGVVPAVYGFVVALYFVALAGLGSGFLSFLPALVELALSFTLPLILAAAGLALFGLALATLVRVRRLQPGTKGRARLTVMAVAGLAHILGYAAFFAFIVYLLQQPMPPTFGGPPSPEELLLPLTEAWLFGFYASLAVASLSLLVLLGASVSAWFLSPDRFRTVFWWISDVFLALVFLPFGILFPIALGFFEWTEDVRVGLDGTDLPVTHGIPRAWALDLIADPTTKEIPVELQAMALAITVLFTLRLSARLLPRFLDLIERGGFQPLVAARHLRAKKSSFLTVIGVLSILAVSVSSCALTTTLSVMGGFRNDLKRKILGNNAHVVIDKEHGTFEAWQPILETARRTDGVAAAAPFVSGEVMVTSASNLAGAVLRGIDISTASDVIDLRANMVHGSLDYLGEPESLLDLPPEEPQAPYPLDIPVVETEGEIPDGPEDPTSPLDLENLGPPMPDTENLDEIEAFLREGPRPTPPPREVLPGIIVGQELARSLRLYVGDEVNVVSPIGDLGPAGPMPKSRPFRVAGIFYSGMYEYDMKYAYVKLDTAQRFLNVGDGISGIEIKVRDVDRAPAIADAIRDRVAREDLEVKDWQELNRTLFGALELERLAMFIFLGIAILVAGFCVFATLTLMVQEKSAEMGILKAMGARREHVIGIFLVEGTLIGVLGAALGLGLGYVACFAAEHFGINMNPEVYYIDKLPVSIDGSEFLLVGVASIVVCVLATVFPATLASRTRPVEALRYD